LAKMPAIHGLTLQQESAHENFGPWQSAEGLLLDIDRTSWNIPNQDARLLGFTQFERLLAEFRNIVENIQPTAPSKDDIANLAVLNKAAHYTMDVLVISCHLASKVAQSTLSYLIIQLHNRIKKMFERLGLVSWDVVMKKVDDSDRNLVPIENVGSVLPKAEHLRDSPHLINAVLDSYNKFVVSNSNTFLQRGLEEFYSADVLAWELQNFDTITGLDVKGKNSDEIIKSTTVKIFKTICTRVAKNVLLRAYQYFFVPLKNNLKHAVSNDILATSTVALREYVGVEVLRYNLELQEKQLRAVLGNLEHTHLEVKDKIAKDLVK